MLTDLSKALYCINHDLFIAKLTAYGFSYKSINFIGSNSTGRNQIIKVNHVFRSYLDIPFGEPQGSILGPFFSVLTFDSINIFLLNSSFDIASYADDNTRISVVLSKI